jgi:XapX domain-containing protein
MKPYLIALAVGLLVGVIYALLNVRSPAPPVIALVGLLGILVGEQIPPLVRHIMDGQGLNLATIRDHSSHHMFGPLPHRPSPLPQVTAAKVPQEPTA